MRIRRFLDATLGRRLLVRIWAHGVLLFGGVIAMVMIARVVMADIDHGATLRERPYLVEAVHDRIAARLAEPAALAREIERAQRDLPIDVHVEGATVTVTPRPGPSVPWHLLLLHTCALVMAFIFVAGPLSRSIVRPIRELGALARELGAGNLAVRANSERRDELGDLARSFDAMAAQIQKLRAAERQLLGDVSHELRTPLARMRVVLELATDADLARARGYLAEITTDLAELEQLVDDIIVSAQLDPDGTRWDEARPPLRKTRTSIGELVAASVARFRTRWPERALEEHRGADLELEADPAMLRRVLDNLLDNARKYSHADSAIAVHVAREDDRVRVEVVDRGDGIAPEDQPRVFTPFFRADRSRTRASGGVGLGLALARRIVDAHGGTIGFDSAPERGSRFWFTLRAT